MSDRSEDARGGLDPQLKLAVAFGMITLGLLLVLAVFIPNPTDYQLFLFRVTLALAAGAIGAIIPGFLHVDGTILRLTLRAGGALAVFLLVYSVNPPKLVSRPTQPGIQIRGGSSDTILPSLADSVRDIENEPSKDSVVAVPNPDSHPLPVQYLSVLDSFVVAVTNLSRTEEGMDADSAEFIRLLGPRWSNRAVALGQQLSELQQRDSDLVRRLFPTQEQKVVWNYDRNGDTLKITSSLPYLNVLRRGGPIKAGVSIKGSYPHLSVALLNNTDRTVYLTEATVNVHSSTRNFDPIIVVSGSSSNPGQVGFSNAGWGAAEHPEMRFTVTGMDQCLEYPNRNPVPTHRVQLPSISNGIHVDLDRFIHPRLRKHAYACVAGVLSYTPQGRVGRDTVSFLTWMAIGGILHPPPAITTWYGLWLPAGESGYTRRFAIDQQLQPRGSDRFAIQLGTNASASFLFEIGFHNADGEEWGRIPVRLEMLVPRGLQPDSIRTPRSRGR